MRITERGVYHDEEWPHGLRCSDCSVLITEGDEYCERLEGFQDDMPIVLIVCPLCIGGAVA